MIACSIINRSAGFPCLAPPVYSYLVTRTVHDAIETAVPDNIPDLEAREVLDEVC